MYIVNKGSERVMVQDKVSATNIILAITMMGSSDSVKNQFIMGSKEDLQVYEVAFLDKHVNVLTQADAEKVIHWMLDLGCKKVSIQKLDKEGEDDGRREEGRVVGRPDDAGAD